MSTVFRVILKGSQEYTPEQLDGKRRRDCRLRQRGGSRELLVRHQGRRFRPGYGWPTSDAERSGDDVTRTHFHTAAAGVNGPIVFGQIDPGSGIESRQRRPCYCA